MSNPNFVTIYTPEVAKEICDLIACGKSIVTISKIEGMPAYRTIRTWIDEKPEFEVMYNKAKEDQAEYLADEILDISDDSNFDQKIDEVSGRVITDKEHIQRSRLRVDARKWVAAKLKPRKYGDFARSEVTGSEGKPLFSGIEITFKRPQDETAKD